jgi:hypothetical protein
MSQRPYRFSKKAGRYISNTQSGNREYYYRLLASIQPNADFDPNSTYGKHIMKKVISDLRKYKRSTQGFKECQNSLSFQLRRLNELHIENKREEGSRRNNAVENRASAIVKKKNPWIAFLKKRTLVIALAFGVVTYMANDEFQISFWVFLGSYLFLTVIGNFIFYQLKKSNLYQAENELRNTDFGSDLREKESIRLIEMNETRSNVEGLKSQLQVIENQIVLKTQELLNKDMLKFILSDQFYNSTDWKKVRDQALATLENVCVQCGTNQKLSVDHIYPRSKFPEKALELSNTQILCLRCNSSKGNKTN